MTSHLRLQSSLATPVTAHAVYRQNQSSSTIPPAKKQKMSLTQTYYVASTARSKLGREARKGDHDLRLLVGHANLLDSLMVELADAEREQEAWFNQSVRTASKSEQSEQSRHIQWADTIAEELAEDSDSDSDSDVDVEEEQDSELFSSHDLDMVDSDDEYDSDHALIRTVSNHHTYSPPELTHDSFDSESDSDEDESLPPSPGDSPLELVSDKQRQAVVYEIEARRRQQHQQIQQEVPQQSHGLGDYAMQQASRAPAVAAC